MPERKIRARMVELGISVEDVAAALGINKSTVYRRLQSPEKLTVRELRNLVCLLELDNTEAQVIFFPPDVAKNATNIET